MHGSVQRITPDMPPPSYWKKNPPGAFQIRNPHAQKMRLQPAGIPSPQQGQAQCNYSLSAQEMQLLPAAGTLFIPGHMVRCSGQCAPALHICLMCCEAALLKIGLCF
eukprot:1153364-Pelagomonas_calceolata.AAC.3